MVDLCLGLAVACGVLVVLLRALLRAQGGDRRQP